MNQFTTLHCPNDIFHPYFMFLYFSSLSTVPSIHIRLSVCMSVCLYPCYFSPPALFVTFSVTNTFVPRGSCCDSVVVTLSVTCIRVGPTTSLSPGDVPARHSMCNNPDSASWKFIQCADNVDLQNGAHRTDIHNTTLSKV